MLPIFNAPNPVAIRNCGGGGNVNNKCTTIGRPQHMNRCRAGAKDAGVSVACRNMSMSSGLPTSSGRDRRASSNSTSPLDSAPGGGRLSSAAPSAPVSSSKPPRSRFWLSSMASCSFISRRSTLMSVHSGHCGSTCHANGLSGLSLIARQATDPAAAAGRLREGPPEQLPKYKRKQTHYQNQHSTVRVEAPLQLETPAPIDSTNENKL